MSDRIPMTQVGYSKILAEVEQLENEEKGFMKLLDLRFQKPTLSIF